MYSRLTDAWSTSSAVAVLKKAHDPGLALHVMGSSHQQQTQVVVSSTEGVPLGSLC
jgi:hypothetical protein